MLTDKSSMPDARGSVLIFLKSESFSQSVKKALESNGYSGTIVGTESLALTEEIDMPCLIILDHGSGSVVNLADEMSSTVPIVAVLDGSVSCEDEACLRVRSGYRLVVCGQSVRELVARVRASFDAARGVSRRTPNIRRDIFGWTSIVMKSWSAATLLI